MYIVSACLAGLNCRYNGSNTFNQCIYDLVQKGEAIPVCPEILGGLESPRDPCEIVSSKDEAIKIVNEEGKNYTFNYKKGADETLKICQSKGITRAIFQQRSPSCGCGCIYDGSFLGNMIEGDGMTTRLLKENQIQVIDDVSWMEMNVNNGNKKGDR